MVDPKDRIVTLIPAFNEELSIGTIVLLCRKFSSNVIVVDDGSRDRTSEIARNAGAEVIRLEKNSGKAKAMMAGFQRISEIDPDCTITIDADGQLNPDEIPAIAAPVLDGRADLVIGSRYLGQRDKIPRHRVVGQKVLNGMTNMGAEQKVTDSQSGYRALSRKGLKNLDFESNEFGIESDMIVHFISKGLVIKEVPMTVRYDVPNGHKKNSFLHGTGVLGNVISVVGYKRPLLFFGIPALILFLIGFILGLLTFFEVRVIFNWTFTAQSIASLSLLALGSLLGVSALILNSLSGLTAQIGRHTNGRY